MTTIKQAGVICSISALVIAVGLIIYDKGEWGLDHDMPSQAGNVSFHSQNEASFPEKQNLSQSAMDHSLVPLGAWRASQREQGQKGNPNLSTKDWRDGAKEISLMSEEDERMKSLEEWLKSRTPDEMMDACVFLWGQEPADVCRELARSVMRHLAGEHPQMASTCAEKLPPGEARDRVMQDVAVVWAGRDFLASVEWIKGWSEGEVRESGLISAGYEAARQNAFAALNLAASLPGGEKRDGLICHAAAQYAAVDPTSAVAWAKQLTDPVLKDRAVGIIATEWSDYDPVAAATFALEYLPQGRKLDDTLISIVQRWVQFQPDEVRAWVMQFPSGSLRDTALEQIALLQSKAGS